MPPVDQIAPQVQLTKYNANGTLQLTRADSATVYVAPGTSAVFPLPNPLAIQNLRLSHPSPDGPAPNDSIAIEFVNTALPPVAFKRKPIHFGNGPVEGLASAPTRSPIRANGCCRTTGHPDVGATRLLLESPANHDMSIYFSSSLPSGITAGVPASGDPVALSVRVTPNPSRGSIGIQWTTQRPSRLEFALHGIAGRTLRSREREVGVGPGTERVDVKGADGIRPGICFLSVRGLGASRSVKTIIFIP